MIVSSWLAGGSVCDHYSGSLTIPKSDRGRLSGVRSRVRAGAAGTRARSRLSWHGSVNSLGDGDVGRHRWAVGRLVDVDSSGRWACTLSRDHRSVFSRLSRNHRADRLAGTWDTGNAVNLR